MPKIIDLFLGLMTLIYLFLGIKGILRSKEWSNKKTSSYFEILSSSNASNNSSFVYRVVVFIVPNLQNNSSTIKDAIGIWPAAMLFLAVVFLIGTIVTVRRVYYRVRLNRN